MGRFWTVCVPCPEHFGPKPWVIPIETLGSPGEYLASISPHSTNPLKNLARCPCKWELHGVPCF